MKRPSEEPDSVRRWLGRAPQVTAHFVGKVVDLLLGLREGGLGPGGALGSALLAAAWLPAGAHGPLGPPEKPHDPILSQ